MPTQSKGIMDFCAEVFNRLNTKQSHMPAGRYLCSCVSCLLLALLLKRQEKNKKKKEKSRISVYGTIHIIVRLFHEKNEKGGAEKTRNGKRTRLRHFFGRLHST